jgi:hypothetical protein
MHSKSTAGQTAGSTINRSNDLELVCYGAGYAWLRPEPPLGDNVSDHGGRSLRGGPAAPARSHAHAVKPCNHREGHELALSVAEALAPVEPHRECPCCNARLWISIPSVGAILDTVAHSARSSVPDLDVDLTRRERQLLNVLHRAQFPLRHRQLAALVWRDCDRTHDVRSVLYRLRGKLRGSGWTIPIPPNGQGVRLERVQSTALAA